MNSDTIIKNYEIYGLIQQVLVKMHTLERDNEIRHNELISIINAVCLEKDINLHFGKLDVDKYKLDMRCNQCQDIKSYGDLIYRDEWEKHQHYAYDKRIDGDVTWLCVDCLFTRHGDISSKYEVQTFADAEYGER